jgi:two-component system NarL family response regulator
MQKLKVLLASWEKVFGEGIVRVLENRPDVAAVTVCRNGLEAIRTASKLKPDIVIIDEGIRDCGFVELSKSIRQLLPQTDIMIITAEYPNTNTKSVLKAEANAYTDKDITVAAFNATIDRFCEKYHFYASRVSPATALAKLIFKEYARFWASRDDASGEGKFGLSKREIEVLTLAAEGKSNKEIGSLLFITENTVKAHMSSIFNKLNLHDRQQIGALAKEKGIVPDVPVSE